MPPATMPSGRPHSVATALLAAGLCVVGLGLTWVLAELVPITHVKDAVALYDFTRLDRPLVEAPARALLDLLYPPFFITWGFVLVMIAVRGGRPRVAIAVALVLALAPLSAELLKPLMAHPHVQLGPKYITNASWPSGHATAALALAWCAVLVAPAAQRRRVALLGAGFSILVGVALLILAWHMPSDVLGGYLLATLWTSLAVAVLFASRRDGGARRSARGRLGGAGRGVGAVRAGLPQ